MSWRVDQDLAFETCPLRSPPKTETSETRMEKFRDPRDRIRVMRSNVKTCLDAQLDAALHDLAVKMSSVGRPCAVGLLGRAEIWAFIARYRLHELKVCTRGSCLFAMDP